MTEQNDQTFHLIIRVKKADSAFIYFQLEANEGLVFYSTTSDSLGMPYRDIEITGHRSLLDEFSKVLFFLKGKVYIEEIESNIGK